MSRGWKIVLGIVIALAVVYAVAVGLLVWIGGGGNGRTGGSGTVGVIELDGVILASSDASFFGGGGIDPIWTAETLRDADHDGGIDAVVLRVNSPGGSPAAAWEIYRAVQTMSKPVVVSVGDIDASGAYYFSSAADLIVAAPASVVGSIGVILEAQNLQELLDKVGIRYTVLTRGKYKDIGNPTREMTSEEKAILERQLDAVYEQFIADVAAGRPNLDEDQVRALATGLAYPGQEALDLGLIDRLGSYRDALDAAALAAALPVDDYGVTYLEPEYGGDPLSWLLGVEAGDVLRGVGRGIASGLREGFAGERLRLE